MRNLDPVRARWMKVRIALLAVALAGGAVAVLHRAWMLQVRQGPELRAMAEEQYLRDVRLAPKRGTIFDRTGAVLAVSVDTDSVWASPRELTHAGGDPTRVALALASVLPGLDLAVTTRRLASDRHFVWIQRRITPREAAAIRALHLPGVAMSREARRYYPNRELAAHVLGFADIDGVGIEGVERELEDRLRGSVSAVPAIRDRAGRVVFSEQLLDDRASQGEDVTLTIDQAIQVVAERELALAVQTSEARAGSVVVLDPRSGEILALANYPTFNPNDPGHSNAFARRDRAITDRFEPGSTMKPFTVAGALAMGAIGPDQPIDCQHGAMQVAEYVIKDTHVFDILTPTEVLAYSSNIGAAKIGQAMGRAGLFRTLRRFGFGEPTGVPLPGETAGILRHYRRWYDMDAATISFGQGMSVTTLQLAMAMGAIANGGRLMDPILVRRVSDPRGDTLEEALPRVRRQVVPEGIARTIADMLTAVTGPGGTGVEAAIDGYVVAGKTGTAQKADYVAGGYAEGRFVASFVGFVPADHPRLCIAVVIDEPVIEHYGGTVAGPAFRRIGEAALQHLGVPAQGGGEVLAERADAVRHAAREQRRELDARRQACREARHAGRHDDPSCVEPAVAPNADAEPIAEVVERPASEGETLVPDVGGMNARRALVALATAGLALDVEGSGLVLSQSPAAGDVAARGAHVRLVLGPRPDPEPTVAPLEDDAEDLDAPPHERRAGAIPR